MADNLRSIDEVPEGFVSVFTGYPKFNVVQSEVLDEVLHTDNNLVVSAPTGSGKTAIFEMAIVRILDENKTPSLSDIRMIYVSPMKALCAERTVDWSTKFRPYGIKTICITGDTDNFNFPYIFSHNLIICTPEKWDILTRRWRTYEQLMKNIKLFMIDEVQLLNADTRGPTLEVIVCRMKTMESVLLHNNQKIRFLALSASIANVEDIADWLGTTGERRFFKFSEDTRPVHLNKIVLGYSNNHKNFFTFDIALTYRLPNLIKTYSLGKPTLVFCSTRKSVEMTASHLVANLSISMSDVQKRLLQELAESLSDEKLKKSVIHGIAIHHAGLLMENRLIIEKGFREFKIPVLVTTSTLAMGVNLPAHLVIIKSTKTYEKDHGYKDYDEIAIFQMVGRAGRIQFDTSGTAVILTSLTDKSKYEAMLNCTQPIESNLHKHLTEHLNAEIVLRTITDLDGALRWVFSTFLYFRAQKCPTKYGLPAGLNADQIDKKLLELCQVELGKLVKAGMCTMNENTDVSATEIGKIMTNFYVSFDTMKLFTEVSGYESLNQLLAMISKCKEFADVRLRVNDKKSLNSLNYNRVTQESIRFKLKGKIATVDMKVNCLIQAVLGNRDILDHSLLNDATNIMRNCERISGCLIEYLQTRNDCYNALLNATILAKCFQCRLWENSPFVAKQLKGIGHVLSNLLVKAGKDSFPKLARSNPRQIEMIVNKKAPFGSQIVEAAEHLPFYDLKLDIHDSKMCLSIQLLNGGDLKKKCTIDRESKMTLLVGNSENKVLLYEQYTHAYMIENPTVTTKLMNIETHRVEFIHADFISENLVGIDCKAEYDFPKQSSNGKKIVQTYLDVYATGKQATTKNSAKDNLTKKLTDENMSKKHNTVTQLSTIQKNKSTLDSRLSEQSDDIFCSENLDEKKDTIENEDEFDREITEINSNYSHENKKPSETEKRNINSFERLMKKYSQKSVKLSNPQEVEDDEVVKISSQGNESLIQEEIKTPIGKNRYTTQPKYPNTQKVNKTTKNAQTVKKQLIFDDVFKPVGGDISCNTPLVDQLLESKKKITEVSSDSLFSNSNYLGFNEHDKLEEITNKNQTAEKQRKKNELKKTIIKLISDSPPDDLDKFKEIVDDDLLSLLQSSVTSNCDTNTKEEKSNIQNHTQREETVAEKPDTTVLTPTHMIKELIRPSQFTKPTSTFANEFSQNKTLRWRSPLIESPANKFSPKFDFLPTMNHVNISRDSIDEQNTTTSSSLNKTDHQIRNSESFKPKNIPRFPLSDRECLGEDLACTPLKKFKENNVPRRLNPQSLKTDHYETLTSGDLCARLRFSQSQNQTMKDKENSNQNRLNSSFQQFSSQDLSSTDQFHVPLNSQQFVRENYQNTYLPPPNYYIPGVFQPQPEYPHESSLYHPYRPEFLPRSPSHYPSYSMVNRSGNWLMPVHPNEVPLDRSNFEAFSDFKRVPSSQFDEEIYFDQNNANNHHSTEREDNNHYFNLPLPITPQNQVKHSTEYHTMPPDRSYLNLAHTQTSENQVNDFTVPHSQNQVRHSTEYHTMTPGRSYLHLGHTIPPLNPTTVPHSEETENICPQESLYLNLQNRLNRPNDQSMRHQHEFFNRDACEIRNSQEFCNLANERGLLREYFTQMNQLESEQDRYETRSQGFDPSKRNLMYANIFNKTEDKRSPGNISQLNKNDIRKIFGKNNKPSIGRKQFLRHASFDRRMHEGMISENSRDTASTTNQSIGTSRLPMMPFNPQSRIYNTSNQNGNNQMSFTPRRNYYPDMSRENDKCFVMDKFLHSFNRK